MESNITFAKADINYTALFDDTKQIGLVTVTLGRIAKQYNLIRLSRGIAVNPDSVQSVTVSGNTATAMLKNGQNFSISRRNIKLLIEQTQCIASLINFDNHSNDNHSNTNSISISNEKTYLNGTTRCYCRSSKCTNRHYHS